VSHIGRTLYEGVPYRHVVLTVPDVIRMPFFHDRSLLADRSSAKVILCL
jgi:hypothetical protein